MSFFATDVRVIVVDPYTNLTVGSVNVSLFDQGRNEFYSGVTDSAGVAYFYGLPSSRYTVYANKAGYRESVFEVAVAGSYQEIPIFLQPNNPPPNPPPPTTVTNIGFHVKDASGAPIQDAIVTLQGVGSQATGPLGVATFFQVAILTYSYSVSKAGWNTSTGTVDSSHNTEPVVTMTPVSEPPPPPVVEYTIRVTVLNGSSVPQAGIAVSGARKEGGYARAGLTDINGIYTFTQAPTGHYDIIINNDQASSFYNYFVESNLGLTAFIANPNPPPIPPPSTGNVTVQVVQDGGTPLNGVGVQLIGPGYNQAQNSANGGYAIFSGVPNGTFTAKVTISGTVYQKSFAVLGNTTVVITVPRQTGPLVTWTGTIPTFKDGTYEWSLQFNIVPIPFLDNYIVDWLAQRPLDESALNSSLASQGIAGRATITDKVITKHTNILGNVDQFTIKYTFTLEGTGLNLVGEQALVAWVPVLIAAIPAIISLLTAVVYLLIVNSILAGLRDIAGPGGKNVGTIVVGAIAITGLWYLGKGKK